MPARPRAPRLRPRRQGPERDRLLPCQRLLLPKPILAKTDGTGIGTRPDKRCGLSAQSAMGALGGPWLGASLELSSSTPSDLCSSRSPWRSGSNSTPRLARIVRAVFPQEPSGSARMAPSAAQRRLRAMSSNDKGVALRNLFKYGGIAASVVLIAFGAGSIGMGAWGINNVRDNLALEQIA